MPAQDLVGRHVEHVLGSWYRHGDGEPEGPLEVWLVDEHGDAIWITTGSDWCLIVDAAPPHDGWVGDAEGVSVGPVGEETPLARHIGERITAVREEHEPRTGRVAVELTFPTGGVRCDSWAGGLRLTAG